MNAGFHRRSAFASTKKIPTACSVVDLDATMRYRPAYASGLIAIGRAAVVRAQAVGQVLRTALVKPATNRVAKAQARSWSPQLAMVRI
jgi:hypothetical protein